MESLGIDVKEVQRALKAQGYNFGPEDGKLGPLTEHAIEMFKLEKGIKPADAKLDPEVCDVLGMRRMGSDAEALEYNNPLSQVLETAWFKGKKYWAIGPNIPIPVDASKTKTAEEYMVCYAVSPHDEPSLVPLQLNIYDSVPGMSQYSPIWHLNYVVVPKDYEANTLRSVEDVKKSGYQIVDSGRYVN